MANAKKKPAKRSVKKTLPTPPKPVTLAEAYALADAKLTPIRHATPRAKSRSGDVTQWAVVAREQQKLRAKRALENKRRIREYKTVMTIMEKRGVKGLQPLSTTPNELLSAPSDTSPLRLFAEGDSWFDYPLHPHGGLIPRIRTELQIPILSLAAHGDEVRFMLGVEQREIITNLLDKGSPAGGRWDAMLFSGGGNDIVGHPMVLWINEYQPHLTAAQLINQPRFDAALSLIRAGYEDLIALRDKHSKDTHLLFHIYDFANPDNRGVCGFGPWLRPSFKTRKFPPSFNPAFDVVKLMLEQFANMLTSFERPDSKISVIRTQGRLSTDKSSWANELHPNEDGFNLIADLFCKKLKQLFPSRIPT